MKLNVGAGSLRLDGFVNVDIRRVGSDSRRGHAADLWFAPDGSVEVLFAHAVFEHVYLAHRLAVLREWSRVLAAHGAIVCLAVPDFEVVAGGYLARAPGATGPTFDLFGAYRYTHGHPEAAAAETAWSWWDPARRVDAAPAGYLPQLHKGLFDAAHIASLLAHVGLAGSVFRYAYPGERSETNLGFVAGAGCDEHDVAGHHLHAIPALDRFVVPETTSWIETAEPTHDRLLEEVVRLEQAGRSAKRWSARVRRSRPW